jgi:thioredoxin 2
MSQHGPAPGATVVTNVIVCRQCGRRNRVPAVAPGSPRCAQCHKALPWITEADDRTFTAVVDEATIPVLVDLWAPWCGPCHLVSPALERLARSHAGTLKLVKVNVDEAPEVSRRFAVQGIPTLVLMYRGDVVARQTGAAPEPKLREWLEQGLACARRDGNERDERRAGSTGRDA